MITTSLLAAIVFSLGLTLLLELLLQPILGLLGTPDELMPMAYSIWPSCSIRPWPSTWHSQASSASAPGQKDTTVPGPT